MSHVDRRSFLKGVAAMTATAMAGETLLGAAPVQAAAAEPQWSRTPCRLCSVGCGLLVGVVDGHAVAVKGDPESPVSRGLACAKGYHAVQALYGRDRITRALVRRDGVLASITLGEALDLTARELRDATAAHGRDAVALYGSGQWTVADAWVASRLFGESIGTRYLDTSARLHSASARAGLRSSLGLDGIPGNFEDIDHADVFVLWNQNLAETEPVLFSRILQRRRTDPAVRIVALGTRTTRTSYAADRALLHAPETEVAIANAIGQAMIARGLADRNFTERYVAFKRGRTGLGDASARGEVILDVPSDASWDDYVRFLADYTPERAAAVSGLAAEDIRWLASLYGDRSRRVVSIWGDAVGRSARGTWATNALHNLHLVSGRIGRPGDGALCLTSQPGAAAGALDAGTIADELGATAIFRAVERGEVRFLWVQGTNPMVSLPHVDRYRKALRDADCFVVVSEAYPTATTEIADLVLPTAMWLERDGVYASAERRVQYSERLLKPPGDATSDAWQMVEVARRLGYGNAFRWDRDHELSSTWAEYSRNRQDARVRLPALSLLRDGTGTLWPSVQGRETRWRYTAAYDPAADRSYGDYDFYGHPDHRAWIWLRPYEPPVESPDQSYPFWLEVGEVLEHQGTGTMTQRIPALHRALPHSYVEMSRTDARALGVRSGERVRLVSRRGALEIEARIEYRSQPAPGRLFAPAFDSAHPVHRLLADGGCPLSGEPTARCAVRVERLTSEGGA